jgi:hypothetical protein
VNSKAHPYKNLPDSSFWSRWVSSGSRASELFVGSAPILEPNDRIISAGSCFAGNIVPFLEAAGFDYIRTERIDDATDRFGYSRYSAAYGNIYTPRQLVQLLRRCGGEFAPVEDRWHCDTGVIDPFRPGLPFPAEDDEEFDLVTSSHLAKTLEAFSTASVFIFTLGLTETWISSIDGAVFPACPGTVAGNFDPVRHRFANFRVVEIIEDLRTAIREARSINPHVRVILTVSPVPLAATATENHVYCATVYSKSALRAACEEVCQSEKDTIYFPAYEIVSGFDARTNFERDLRTVNEVGLKSVVDALFDHCIMPMDRPAASSSDDLRIAADLSGKLARFECEEAMTDPSAF